LLGAELHGAWTSKNNTRFHAQTYENKLVSDSKRPASQKLEALALANASGRLRVRNAQRMEAKPQKLLLDDDWSLRGATMTSSKTPN
jgi:plasmid maintenance system killer protein